MHTPLPRLTWTHPETLLEALGVRCIDDGGAAPGDSQGGSGDQPADAGSGDQSGEDGKDTGDAKDKPDALPDDPTALKAEIAKLRKENAGARTAAKDKAAAAAREELVQSLGKALGLVKDGQDAPTPEQLAEQASKATAAARTATVELAVYRAAGTAGADADALLDSRAFLAKVADLDPADKNFTTKVAEAITDAVKTNPKLKAGRAPGASSVDHSAGGSGEGRKPTPVMTLEDAYKAKFASAS